MASALREAIYRGALVENHIMSLIGDALAPYALISSPMRAISFLIPDVVIEELHTDDLAVTDHPVETGAAISDHAFKLPARVEIRCGWSNSNAEAEGYVQQINAALISLQAKREPFTVYTGKRVYQNMLAGRVGVETNAEAENALLVSIGLREVIITQTQTTGAAQSAQAMPEKTGSISETGTVSPDYAGDPSASPSGPGSNTDFLNGSSSGIGNSGASAGFDEITFNGETLPSGLADGVTTFDPSAQPGNLGLFGRYGPTALSGSTPFKV